MKNNQFIYGMVFVMLCGLFLAAYKPFIPDDKTAFGELSVTESTPVVQLQFPYNINTRIVEVRDNFGISTVVNNMANLSTGAAANQSANILSLKPVKYNAGQGGLWRGTAVFTTGVANSFQWIGIGDSLDGYFFGYNGATFSILRRQGGVPETRRLAITTGSTGIDDVTITLNGNALSVSLTGASDTTVTANEIAAADYSNVGRGWEVHAMGANVFFRSYSDDARSGTYTLTDATSAVGSFSQSLAGATATESITAITSWSEDKMAGAGPSSMTLNPTKGNVYQIRYEWLGFGAIEYSIENDDTGAFQLVHRIDYSNVNIIPSVNNPTLPLCAIAENISNTSDIVLKIGSSGGFIEGRNEVPGVSNSFGTQTASISTTETPIFTLHSHDIYKGKVNRVGVKMLFGSISVDGTKPAIIRVRKNATLVGSSFSPLDSDTATIHIDSQATSVTGDAKDIIFQQSVAKAGTATIDFEKLQIMLFAPDFLTLSIEATSGTTDAVSTFNWEEKF